MSSSDLDHFAADGFATDSDRAIKEEKEALAEVDDAAQPRLSVLIYYLGKSAEGEHLLPT